MRTLIDTNILVYAHDKDSANHESASSVVTAALARYFEKPIHTIFSGFDVWRCRGLHLRSRSQVQTLHEHDDFGLCTFADLGG